MTTTLLKKALYDYLDNNTVTISDKEQIEAFINDCDDIERKANDDSIWKYECYVMHAEDVSDLMNAATYDDFGKLYVANDQNVSLEQYTACIDNYYHAMPNSVIQLGYDVIYDLYSDNDALDSHYADGTFNPLGDCGLPAKDNLAAALGQLLIDSDCKKTKPADVRKAAYEMLLAAGISEYCSATFANSMQQLAGLIIEDASTDWDKRMIKESREVMSMLEYCMNEPDADISISVKHKNGKSATANLYDHAALVQELYSALKYFIEEMQ